jgi:putative hydrolase of HD superfamily
MNRLEKQMNFLLEVDKLKKIVRQTYLSDGERKENDAEHSWHLALMAVILSEYANQDIDILKVVSMVLIHDIVEIDAGDTYAYDQAMNETKREREEKAADRLFHLLPEDQAQKMRELWEEFERAETFEAKFALTLDKIQPIMLNDASLGKSWKEHGVYADQIYNRNRTTKDGSAEIWEYGKNLIEKNIELGNIADRKERE